MNKPKVKKPVWKTVHTMDVKYDSFSLKNFVEEIKQHVPEGTADEDIDLEFIVEEEHGYYDDVLITATMLVKVKTND